MIGEWTGKPKLTAAQKSNPVMAQYASMIGSTDLVVEKNHSFTMTDHIMGNSLVVKGTWKFGGTTLVLIPGKIGDRYVDELRSSFKDNKTIPASMIGQQIQCVLSSDGTLIAHSASPATDFAPVEFTRK